MAFVDPIGLLRGVPVPKKVHNVRITSKPERGEPERSSLSATILGIVACACVVPPGRVFVTRGVVSHRKEQQQAKLETAKWVKAKVV